MFLISSLHFIMLRLQFGIPANKYFNIHKLTSTTVSLLRNWSKLFIDSCCFEYALTFFDRILYGLWINLSSILRSDDSVMCVGNHLTVRCVYKHSVVLLHL